MKCDALNIRVLTYTAEHRKTYDTLCLLKANGYVNVKVYAKDFHYNKTFWPIYEHRPSVNVHIPTKMLCENLGYEYEEIESYEEISESENTIFLVCGAGILPQELIKKYKIINAHPGYIPNERGLDALKWAIVEKEPVGVTTHFIGDEVDAGEIIMRETIPVYANDTFHAVAQRVYEREVVMLVEAISMVMTENQFDYIAGDNYIVHRRMPKEVEKDFLDMFERYKKEFVK